MAAYGLRITGAAGGTLDLTDDVNFSTFKEWQPRIATRNREALAGWPVYRDTLETIPIIVRGATQSDLMANLERLAGALDQAESWAAGDPIDPILLEYDATNGGTFSKAVIYGPGPGASDLLALPPTFNAYKSSLAVGPVMLPVLRGGYWVETTESELVASQGIPNIFTTVQFSRSPEILTPYNAFIHCGERIYKSQLFVSFNNAAAKHHIIEPEVSDLTRKPAGGDLINQALSQASGGAVCRAVPTALGDYIPTMGSPFGSFSDDVDRIAIVVTLANRSVNVSWQIKALVYGLGITSPFQTDPITIAAGENNNDPLVVPLGEAVFKPPLQTVQIVLTPSDIGGAGGSDALDLDIVAITARDDNSRVTFVAQTIQQDGASFVWDNRINVHPDPELRSQDGPDVPTALLDYQGDVYLAATGDIISALVIGTSDTSEGWTIRDDTDDSNVTAQLQVTKSYSTLAPR